MCYFVTVGVPAQSAARVSEAFGPDLRIGPTANPSVLAALPYGFTAHLVTNGHCSCNLYGKPRSTADEQAAAQHLRQKYAKKGWSEAKFARAMAQVPRDRLFGLSADLVPRLQALCEVTGFVAVVVHWFSGGVEDESLTLTRGLAAGSADLPARAAALVEDEVLYVTADRPRHRV